MAAFPSSAAQPLLPANTLPRPSPLWAAKPVSVPAGKAAHTQPLPDLVKQAAPDGSMPAK